MTEQANRGDRCREEQQFVESVFDALSDILYALDTDGYPIRWNDQVETVTGYTGEEIEEMHFTEFIPDDEVDTTVSHFRTILERRQSVTFESTLETKHGDRIPFEYSGAPLEDGDGNLRGVTGFGRDISDRKNHAEKLGSLNSRSQDLMTADTREQIATIGVEAARDILGLTANAIHLYDEGRSGLAPVATTDAVHDFIDEQPVFTDGDSIAWRAYANGEAVAVDHLCDDPDVYNPETALESELYLPLGDHGILITGSSTSGAFEKQDLVLGEIWAGNIAAALDQFEQTERLHARERELKRQNERLEEFASLVSHDLRNPLNVASARLEFAREEYESEHHDAIETALDRMERIIRDMLQLAREGRDIGEIEPAVLNQIAEDAWKMVSDETATIEPARSAASGRETIAADPDRLRQLLENLFRDAVDHGGENVTVTVGQLADGFYVEADEPGIPAAHRDQIFDAGYSTTRNGTGFGSSIVEQIARPMTGIST